MTIIEKLYLKEPRFPKQYEYLFNEYALYKGGGEEKRHNKAKVFRNDYEFYMYAFFTGVKNKRNFSNRNVVDFSNRKVWNIENWKPKNLRDYIISCALVEAKTPLREYDFMDEKQLNNKSVELKEIIEGYTHGGLSIIDARYEEDRHYFNETFAFTNFVFEK